MSRPKTPKTAVVVNTGSLVSVARELTIGEPGSGMAMECLTSDGRTVYVKVSLAQAHRLARTLLAALQNGPAYFNEAPAPDHLLKATQAHSALNALVRTPVRSTVHADTMIGRGGQR